MVSYKTGGVNVSQYDSKNGRRVASSSNIDDDKAIV
jgi:hypothetical protein